MPEKPALDSLRRQIDAIDHQILDLLRQRTEVVESVRDLKSGEPVKIRPAREDEILYRLVRRLEGSFPKASLARIWRELIVATLSFEGPFSVAVHAPDGEIGCWDLARDHYGSHTPMTAYPSVGRVVELVRNGSATVGVLAFPQRDDREPWWPQLAATAADAPRVIARLPMAGPGNARGRVRDALAICPMQRGPLAGDRALLALEFGDEPGLARLADLLKKTGIDGALLDARHQAGVGGMHLHLIEVDAAFAVDDPRLAELEQGLGQRCERAIRLGAYGLPLRAAELAPAQPREN
jgi:chorismate mutase